MQLSPPTVGQREEDIIGLNSFSLFGHVGPILGGKPLKQGPQISQFEWSAS